MNTSPWYPGPPRTAGPDEPGADWVLAIMLNISLPLVLFFLLLHREEGKRSGARVKDLEGAVKEVCNTPAGEALEDRNRAILKEQRQRIVVARLEVEGERRKDLRLTVDPARVVLAEGRLVDPEIKAFCQASKRVHSDPRAAQDEVRQRILERAQLTPDGPARNASPAGSFESGAASAHAAREGRLAPENAEFLELEVTRLLACERESVINLQLGLVITLMGRGESKTDSTRPAGSEYEAHHRTVLVGLRREFEEHGEYPLLQDTWKALGILPGLGR